MLFELKALKTFIMRHHFSVLNNERNLVERLSQNYCFKRVRTLKQRTTTVEAHLCPVTILPGFVAETKKTLWA